MRSPSEGLFCTREKTREKWQVHKVMDVKDPSLPHFTCVLFENTIPQEMGLRRSELYSALGPMIGRYCERTDDRLRDPGPIFRYRHHQFAPVRFTKDPFLYEMDKLTDPRLSFVPLQPTKLASSKHTTIPFTSVLS